MKKNLKFLTGIVFLIAILIASACSSGEKKTASAPEDIGTRDALIALKPAPDDTTTVDIYLRDIEINGEMHLEMYDSKKPGCPVIDGLITVVHRRDTVIFRHAQHSKIDEVIDVRAVKPDIELFSAIERIAPELFWLEIDPDVTLDTVKYVIEFTVKGYKDTTFVIDPYLKIPDQ